MLYVTLLKRRVCGVLNRDLEFHIFPMYSVKSCSVLSIPTEACAANRSHISIPLRMRRGRHSPDGHPGAARAHPALSRAKRRGAEETLRPVCKD
jgi:hypothetical protein